MRLYIKTWKIESLLPAPYLIKKKKSFLRFKRNLERYKLDRDSWRKNTDAYEKKNTTRLDI